MIRITLAAVVAALAFSSAALADGEPPRALYCQNGVTLNLYLGQNPADAVPAHWVEAVGVTCDPAPAGYVHDDAVLTDGFGTFLPWSLLVREYASGGYRGVIYAVWRKA